MGSNKSPKGSVGKRSIPTKQAGKVIPEDLHDAQDDGVSLGASSDEYDDEVDNNESSSAEESGGETGSTSESEGSELDIDSPVRTGGSQIKVAAQIHSSVRNQDEDDEITLDKLNDLKKDPQVRRVLDLLYEEEKEVRHRDERRREREMRRYYKDKYSGRYERSRGRNRNRSRSRSRRRSTSRCSHTRSRSRSSSQRPRTRSRSRSRSKSKWKKGSQRSKNQVTLKSPSDVTLYTPALRKDKTVATSPTLLNLVQDNHRDFGNKSSKQGHGSLIDQISDLVERVRVEQDLQRPERCSASREPDRRHESTPVHNPGRSLVRPEVIEGREQADAMVAEAERFKASVQPLRGEFPGVQDLMKCLADNDDDDFFHLTCHVDEALRSKIEKGEFVDLDRLLPKTRTQIMHDDQLLQQFVNKNGSTYWGPPEKESRISNVRRWEQAFRVYAAIYSKANPDRASEIWQYVYVINTASASYAWENVYFYDFTFRQLMAEKPNRSWAKTYTQLWNLAMCDHLPKGGPGNFQGQDKNHNNNTNSSFNSGTSGNWRDRCCWRFNKGNKCKKWSCRYDHRCSSCGAWSHPKNTCNKRNEDGTGKSGNARARSVSPKTRHRKY